MHLHDFTGNAVRTCPAIGDNGVVYVGAGNSLVALNADFFRFLLRRRGPLFALGAVPLYRLYLLICGFGFGFGLLRHLVGRL